MNSSPHFSRNRWLLQLAALICSVAIQIPLFAQTGPTLVSSVPANGASGVSPDTPVVFTFSTAMDTTQTSATFFDSSYNLLSTVATWSADMTRLTNTPASPWPTGGTISWAVIGQDANGNSFTIPPFGSFTVGSGGGGGGGTGSGTNKITHFSVGRVNYYDQSNTAPPSLNEFIGYGFSANTTLASNRTATSISVALPTGATNLLSQNPIKHETYYFFDSSTNQAPFDAQYPGGDYVIDVQSATSNQQVTLSLPDVSTQPPAPHVSNYTQAQAVDPTQPFTLTWDAYAGGTTADLIGVTIDTNFVTGTLGSTNVLNGTATSVVIPANTLPPSRTFDSCHVTFYHYVETTNSSYSAIAYRSTTTQFTLTTTSGAVTGPLVLTNAVHLVNGSISFGINASPGQTFTVEYSTNLHSGVWTKLFTTNSTGSQVLVTEPQSGPQRFYRAVSP